jgi:putative FmdB family regulatory protein
VPIYGYRCSNCGHEFEIQQRMSDEPLKVCPKCQGKLSKMLYPTGVIFKGSGFYSTDYKGSGQQASSNGSGSEGKSETKTEPKPESKPESKSESSD